jgi:RNA polymerase sigma factor (sigma-70 family)
MNPNPTDNNEWIALLRQRDTRGFSWLYDQYAGVMLGCIFKVVGDKDVSEDLLQDAFVKIWKNIEQYDAVRGTFFSWIFNIARNTAIDYRRSKAFKNEEKNTSLENIAQLDQQHSEQPDVSLIGLRDVVFKLDTEYREIIDLIYFFGFTQEETAQKLNIPLGTVKTRTRAAILKLRKMI